MLEYIVERLTALIGPLQNLSRDRRGLKDNALRAISHALNETYLYYEDLSQGMSRDRDIERQLSNYWAAAAIPLRHIDEEVAMICEHKAEFWVNPDNWTADQIAQHGIALDGLRVKYRQMLTPKLAKAGMRARIEPGPSKLDGH